MAKLKGLFRRVAKDFINLPRVKHLQFKTGPRRGKYNTPALRSQRVKGRKPTREQKAAARRDFERRGGPRDQFLLDARKNATTTELQALGWSDDQIRLFRDTGIVPHGYAVHHRIPINGGGGNERSNLVLIKNDPDHDLITARQNSVLKGFSDGAEFETELPVTPPGLTTWPQPGTHAHKRR